MHQKRLQVSGRQFTRIQLEVPDHFLGVLRLHFPVVNFEMIAYDINVLLACFYEVTYPHRVSLFEFVLASTESGNKIAILRKATHLSPRKPFELLSQRSMC